MADNQSVHPRSPSNEKRVLDLEEHRLKVVEDEKAFIHDNTWQSCCFKLDRRSVQFFSGLAVSLIVMAVCIAKILGTEPSETYLNLMILILGSPQVAI